MGALASFPVGSSSLLGLLGQKCGAGDHDAVGTRRGNPVLSEARPVAAAARFDWRDLNGIRTVDLQRSPPLAIRAP